MTRTLFISDLHLDESRPAIVAQFERFLGEVTAGADALYILGDLFEYWVGDDSLTLPFQRRIAAALGALTGRRSPARGARSPARGARVPVRFMHGNRDFLVAQRFAQETGIELIADPDIVDLYGTRTLLMHGDTLCTDDTAYQAFRAQVRAPAWQNAMLARPLEQRMALAHGLRAESEGAKQGKAMDIMDVTPATVEKAFLESGCDVMIHGHTHRPGRHLYRVAGRERVRWVLPDWYERGGYLEASPAGISAIAAF